ncbi:BLUF domain-containing protein [Shewanella sp. GXUN23E]|uniref:BLUF domain-containing protein n=1 Tax=Shewanella sp. GXUN23E TaxID=3422498 RepID=UPI003D7DB540
MKEPLIQLIYISCATRLFREQELEGMVTNIRANNQKLGVTGMLLYRDGDFIQALEGPESVVNKLYQQILQDQRHTGIFELLVQIIEKREFADWSMGFSRISETELPGYNDLFKNRGHITKQTQDAGIALSLMRNFARRQ